MPSRPLPPTGLVAALCAALLAAGCANFPAVDAVEGPEIDAAPYPALVPLDGLLATEEPAIGPEDRDRLIARAAALRARSAGMSDAETLSPEARARIDAGVARP